MSQDPRSGEDFSIANSFRHDDGDWLGRASRRCTIQQEITDISRTLAAHGAGALSAELAFDLVLHEIVVELREATHATGAAIAWLQEGEMVCRATTGSNAPGLGMRVDTESSLARACVNTGQVQIWRGAESGGLPPFAERYERLEVRSALVAPISEAGRILGLVQLFSSAPDAFEDKEIVAIRNSVAHCIEARTQAEAWRKKQVTDSAISRFADDVVEGMSSFPPRIGRVSTEFGPTQKLLPGRQMMDASSYVLLAAVLTVAIVLGMLVGWRKGSEKAAESSERVAVARTPSANLTEKIVPAESSVGASSKAPSTSGYENTFSANGSGSLVIFENGKVIFRSADAIGKPLPSKSSDDQTGVLLHRVNPEYPREAIAENVEGPVVLDVGVRGDGSVGDVMVKSGNPLLTQAATDAVRQWRFARPADQDAVDRRIRVTIRFTLPVE